MVAVSPSSSSSSSSSLPLIVSHAQLNTPFVAETLREGSEEGSEDD
jgi:hypothetical protein